MDSAGDAILSLHVTGKLSETLDFARIAANLGPGAIGIVAYPIEGV